MSLFCSFLIFALKRNEAKHILFRFIFACFCETIKKIFRFISHSFALIFFAISFQPSRFKTKISFFAIWLRLFCFKILFSLFCFNFFASKHFFRYYASTFLLQNSAADPDPVGSVTFWSDPDPATQCCGSGSVRIRNFFPVPDP
jgi:hypothetical protein